MKMFAHFERQAGFCRQYGSPFTAELLERLARELQGAGTVADLLADWNGEPNADAVALRLAGALHYAALTGYDAALADAYRRPGGAHDAECAVKAAVALVERDPKWVRAFMASPPQTNEVRRSIALLPGFLAVAAREPEPFALLELGASAGLNLLWDRYGYRTGAFAWNEGAAVQLDTAWTGAPPPLPPSVRVGSRAACDQNPLDVSDADVRRRLVAYIWADQHERIERFELAAEEAQRVGVRVERADAAAWLTERLATRRPDRPTVVFHSVFLQYPPCSTREAIEAAMVQHGARATEHAPLYWLRLEPEAVLGGPANSVRFLVELRRWPGAERVTLAETDGHARFVHYLGPR